MIAHLKQIRQLFYHTQQPICLFPFNVGELGERENASPDKTAEIKLCPFLKSF